MFDAFRLAAPFCRTPSSPSTRQTMDPPPSSRSTREPAKSIVTASRRARWLGSAIALLALAAVLALAWYLTHRPADYGPGASPGAGGAPRGAAGPRGGPSARSAPPSTVGVARARHADIPVYIEALGTVTP